MKYLLILLSFLIVSCGSFLPTDLVEIGVKFRTQVSAPEPFKTVSITIEDDGKTTKYDFTNLITPRGNDQESYYSRSKKLIRITAQFPNQAIPNVVEFVVNEYNQVRPYSVQYEEADDGSFTVTCLTPTKPCPVLP
jgi:hypothetical protein